MSKQNWRKLIKITQVDTLLKLSANTPIIDVRSPSEFENGHIFGAINVPIFSDTEHKIIGTKYKQESRDTALATALEIIAKKTDFFLNRIAKINSENIAVYCWRGGFRSDGMAHLFQSVGKNVFKLDGGYKSFRQHISQFFEQGFPFIILGGKTGSDKTKILYELAKQDEQVIDLEKLADHKGSAFGAIGEVPQKSLQQFENNLFDALQKLTFKKRIWLEDESRMIGRLKIPDAIFRQIRSTNVINLEIPKKRRISNLMKNYTHFETVFLIDAVNRISRKLGGLNTKLIIDAIEQNDFFTAIDIVLNYYDKTYQFGLSKRDLNTVFTLKISTKTNQQIAENLKIFVNNHDDEL